MRKACPLQPQNWEAHPQTLRLDLSSQGLPSLVLKNWKHQLHKRKWRGSGFNSKDQGMVPVLWKFFPAWSPQKMTTAKTTQIHIAIFCA
jgi:hypothetical protein